MNKKRWFWASIVVFIIIFALEYLFNNVCLKNIYLATAHLWRPEAELSRLLPLAWAGYLVMAFFFTFIYAKGYEAKPSVLGEGLRYGLVIGLFISVPTAGMCYIFMPVPLKLAVYWFIMGMVEFLAAGAAVGLIYKKPVVA